MTCVPGFFALIFLLSEVALGQASVRRFERSTVVITVTKQTPDYDAPWNMTDVKIQRYHAILIDSKTFLTTAFAVAGAKQIEMKRYGSSRKWSATRKFVDYESNLALLSAEDPAALNGLVPIPRGGPLELGQSASVLFGLDGVNLASQPVALQFLKIGGYYGSDYPLPFYGLESSKQSGFGWAEPAVVNGKLVALTFGQQGTMIRAIPLEVIEHFLKDTHTLEGYRGFPILGVVSTPLVSPSLRQVLGASKYAGGIRVVKVHVNSPFRGQLLPDDVIVKVGGQSIDERGNVVHKRWGKIYLSYLIGQKYGGDTISVDYVRQGEPKKANAELKRYDGNANLLPFYNPDAPEPHLIFGGIVLRELSRSFLAVWGGKWQQNAPDSLLYFWNILNAPPDPPDKRVIVLSKILADKFNRGYTGYSNRIVETVNGVVPNSLEDLRRILGEKPVKKNDARYAVFGLANGYGDVVLGYAGLNDAHKRIAKSYGIPSETSFYSDGGN